MTPGREGDIYERIGVQRVINASGKMTMLGGTAVTPEVASAMAEAAQSYVSIEALLTRAGAYIADITGAEAACVTSGASAGIAQMVAACIAGTDTTRIERLPDVEGDRRDILIQAGHVVSFGAPITQMIRMGGGRPVAIGWANAVTAAHLTGAISERTVAMLYVQSHHTVHKGMLNLATCMRMCNERGIPVLVDAAAEEDLRRYISLGVDAVTYSGGKAIGGPTSGFIAGRKPLIEACRAQERGIARPMKVGKEQIAGLIEALRLDTSHDEEATKQTLLARVDRLVTALSGVPHLVVSTVWDEAGRAIPRVALAVTSGVPGCTAPALLAHLRDGTPPIHLRGHEASQGTLFIDPRPLADADVDVVAKRIAAFCTRPAGVTTTSAQ